ncbi:MAG: hypothetical protein GY711_20720 [bacterium]|nr:hypothetical protein [bacterium]
MTDALAGIIRLQPDRSLEMRIKANELEVHFDAKSGHVVPKPGRYAFWKSGAVRTYLVTVERLQEMRPLNLVLRGLVDPNSRLEVKALMHVQCPASAAAAGKLVEALVTDEHANPEAGLASIVEESARDFEARLRAQQVDPIDDFCDRRATWEAALIDSVQRLTGLEVTLRLEVDADIGTLKIEEAVTSRLADCDERIEVRFACELLVEDRSRATAAQPREADLREAIEREVSDWITAEIKVEGALDGFQAVHRDLLRVVRGTSLVQEHGRRVDGVEGVEVLPRFELEAHKELRLSGIEGDLRDCDVRASVDLELHLAAEDPRLVLLAERAGRNQAAILGDFTRRWFPEYCDARWVVDEPAECERALRSALEDEVRKSGYRLLSLSAVPKPKFEFERRIVREPHTLSATLEDRSTRVNAVYSLVLSTFELATAIRSYPQRERWLTALDEEVLDYCAGLSLDRVFTDPTSVENGLKDYLGRSDGLLAAQGWKINGLEATIERPFDLPSSKPVEHVVSCIISSGTSESVDIKHTFRVEVFDVCTFQAAKVGDIVGWLKGRLDDLTQTELLKLTYLEVIRGFGLLDGDARKGVLQGGIGAGLEEKIQTEAKHKGCNVQQLSSVLDEEISTLVSIGIDEEVKVREYETKKAGVAVKLSLHLEGRLVNLNRLNDRGLLRHGVKLKTEILGATERAAARVIHTLEPSSFYARFASVTPLVGAAAGASVVDPGGVQNGVEDGIRESVRSTLDKELGLDCVVTVKRAPTEFTIWLSGIIGVPRELEIGVETGDIPTDVNRLVGGQPDDVEVPEAIARFQLGYKIIGVDADQFHIVESLDHKSSAATLKSMDDAVRGAVLERTQMMPSDFLEHRDPVRREEFKHFLFEGGKLGKREALGVKREILDSFGLRMHVNSFYLKTSAIKVALGADDRLRQRRAQMIEGQRLKQIEAALKLETRQIEGEVRELGADALEQPAETQGLLNGLRKKEQARLHWTLDPSRQLTGGDEASAADTDAEPEEGEQ